MDVLHYIANNWDTLAPEVLAQLQVPLLSVAVAAVVGVAMGIWGSQSTRADAVFTAVNSALLTVPSLALFGITSFLVGTGNLCVEIGLVLYALLPIQRNTTAGIRAVRPEVVDAARGMGMRGRQVLSRIELPLALPVIIAGVRQATVALIAITTIGAQYDSDNLGRPILAVQRSQNLTQLLAVTLLVVAIALIADGILAMVQLVLSRGRITQVSAS